MKVSLKNKTKKPSLKKKTEKSQQKEERSMAQRAQDNLCETCQGLMGMMAMAANGTRLDELERALKIMDRTMCHYNTVRNMLTQVSENMEKENE